MNKFLIGIIIIVLFSGCYSAVKQQYPNILILYADDLGWSDAGCYGSLKNQTPHIDQLAANGLLFTNAYAPAPICSASRASIMTGKSPARLNFEFVSTSGRITDKPLLPPKRTLELPLKEITLGEIAQSAGYNTAFFGKWHIAKHNGGYLKWSDTHGPLQQGFETGSDNYGSHPYNEKNRVPVNLKKGEYPADSLVKEAVNYIEEQQGNNSPFFLFFSSYYVHTPVIPNNSWLIEKYRKRMPEAADNEVNYAAFVESMDHYFGQLLEALKKYGFDENTLVIFTSDNGGHPAYTDNAPLKGNKWNLYEGGIREPFIIKWPAVFKNKGEKISVPIIQWDILPTLCELMDQPIPEDVDGTSLLPILRKPSNKIEREMLYWHFPYYHPPKSYEGTKPCSAIREGDYKLIYFYEDKHMELYNLGNDMKEKKDLSTEFPETAERLKNDLLKQLEEVDARFPEKNN